MISREQLAQEYIKIINNFYPVAGHLLRHCVVKILQFNTNRKQSKSYYLGIYYPHKIGAALLEQQGIFKDAAENMGFIEVIFLNANSIVKDPHSQLKNYDFRFWLELCWIVQNTN